jgi:hypothetical protein
MLQFSDDGTFFRHLDIKKQLSLLKANPKGIGKFIQRIYAQLPVVEDHDLVLNMIKYVL